MFSDLKKGFQVHTLDTNTVPKYELGKVVAVSEPRYLPPQPGQYQAMQTRVVDLTVELTGETKTYTVPESQNVAKAMGITLSTSIDPIMNELNAIKNTSQDIINSVDAHRAKIEACESILEDINPAFKQTREQDRKIAGIENKVNDLTDSFEDLKKLLEASVDYFYPNHPEVEFEKDFNIQYDVNNILNKYGHTEMGLYKIQLYVEKILGSIQNKKPVDVGEVSDGYHTFNELYRYRMLYNAAFFNLLARSGQVEVCKSRRHSDGEKCFGSDDWFIVMAILPTGQVSNHYESKYWDLFDVPERETAFEYDGHTPNEAADRLEKYLKLPRHGMTFEKALERLKLGRKIKRIDWGKKYICMFDVNILMIDTGKKVASNWNPTEHDIMSNDWEIAE